MKKSEYLLKSLINALGVFVYVSIVAWLIFNGEHIFDNKPSFLIPLFMLLLFIISASVTGLLVMGKPIHLYLSGLKKEAFILLFTTLAWLIFFIVVIITGLLLF
jgi:small-conductance mechanosensitive channel